MYNLKDLTVHRETSFLQSGPPRFPTFGGTWYTADSWESMDKCPTTITLCISRLAKAIVSQMIHFMIVILWISKSIPCFEIVVTRHTPGCGRETIATGKYQRQAHCGTCASQLNNSYHKTSFLVNIHCENISM